MDSQYEKGEYSNLPNPLFVIGLFRGGIQKAADVGWFESGGRVPPFLDRSLLGESFDFTIHPEYPDGSLNGEEGFFKKG